MNVTPTNTLIEIENVSYYRGDTYLLREINWEIQKNENWVLFGPNGAGKTTLLKILTGYLRPSEGRASVLGETIGKTNVPELRKKIGWISNSLETLIHFEDPGFEIVLAGANAYTRLWEKPTSEHITKAKFLMKYVGCEDYATKSYKTLSQGEQQKILIARAMMNDPELIILDEPCAGLDIAAREFFLTDILNLQNLRNHPTIILVTHHVEEILPCFKNIALIKNGQIIEQGKISDILTDDKVSSLFEMKIQIKKQHERYFSFI
jgi:iron complex transport system ATP-binding protein